MLKNVIFDCGGVLFRWDPTVIMKRYFPEEYISMLMPVIFREWHKLDNGTGNYEEYAEATCDLVPDELKVPVKTFFERLYFELEPIEQTWALIGRLLARHYHIYLLSNAPTVLAENAFVICPLMRTFDGIVVSAPIKMVKPGREIFEYAVEQWKIKPAESLFIDDMQQNIDGAKACGFNGYCYSEDADALLGYIEELSR